MEEEEKPIDAEVEYGTTYEEPPLEVRKIAVLSWVPRFHTLRFEGVVQGKEINDLVYGGATHKFIDTSMVERRNIPTKKFGGFTVTIPSNHSMECSRWIP